MSKKRTEEEILQTLSNIGSKGATITEIEKHVNIERHTVSKYLQQMEKKGVLVHLIVGKAKVWTINKAPLTTILQSKNKQLTYTEKILSAIIGNLPLGLIIIDKTFTIQFTNESIQKKYGEIQNSLLYESVFGLPHPLKLEKIAELFGGQESSECILEDKFENILRIKATKTETPDGNVSAILIIEDITKSNRAEETIAIQRMELQAERDALNSAAIVAETDLDGKITYVNDLFVTISGYARDELLGKTHSIVNSGKHPKEFFADMWNTISSGKVWKGIICNKKKNGSLYYVDSAIAPVIGKENKPIKYIAIRFDITKSMQKS